MLQKKHVVLRYGISSIAVRCYLDGQRRLVREETHTFGTMPTNNLQELDGFDQTPVRNINLGFNLLL
jgi:hypothetical protein